MEARHQIDEGLRRFLDGNSIEEDEEFEFIDDFEIHGEGISSDLDEQNDEKLLNRRVMEHFNIPEDSWYSMTEEGRQVLRDDYSRRR